jgi:hypothetical protein
MGVGAGAVSWLSTHPSMLPALPVSLGGGNVTIVPVGVYIGSWLAGTGAFEIEAGGKGAELEGMRSPPEPVANPWY